METSTVKGLGFVTVIGNRGLNCFIGYNMPNAVPGGVNGQG